jgi:hypothetical protein
MSGQQNEMSRDIALTSDFIRVRHIMLNADLVFVRVVDAKVGYPT